MSTIVSPSEFIPTDNMMYTKPKINSVGGKSIGIINTATKRSLMISTPMMLNWGVNVFENANASSSYSISLQFPRDEFASDGTNQFLEMLKNMENKILEDAVTNSKDWFGKSQSREVVEAFWNPILKYPKDPDTKEPDTSRSPTLKVKLPMWDGEYKFELFDIKNNLLIPNEQNHPPELVIQKASNIACVLQCGGIWMANGNFGVSWKLFQGIYKENIQLQVGKGVCHVPLSLEDVNKLASSDASSAEDTNPTTYVESDDEESEPIKIGADDEVVVSTDGEVAVSTEEGEVESVEEEKPKKKRVVKKKIAK